MGCRIIGVERAGNTSLSLPFGMVKKCARPNKTRKKCIRRKKFSRTVVVVAGSVPAAAAVAGKRPKSIITTGKPS